MNLSPRDQAQLENLGISFSQYEKQICQIREGIPYLAIDRPATINDGIFQIEDLNPYLLKFEQLSSKYKLQKFVPASGAATRMFKSFYEFIETFSSDGDYSAYVDQNPEIGVFFESLHKFPFASDLFNSTNFTSGLSNDDRLRIVNRMLNEPPFEFGSKPKALLPFHKEEQAYTPLFVHLNEAINYANGSVHFTISEQHLELISGEIERLKNKVNQSIEVTYSFQKKHTDTPALTTDFNPVRAGDGLLLFRPGGHGALIENLSELSSDFVFIKNIDNICVRRNWSKHNQFKRALGGFAFEIQEQIHQFQKEVCEFPKSVDLNKIKDFLKANFGFDLKEESKDPLFDIKNALFRPLRVCAMVKNEGEPGGGPFWVKTEEGERLQIVESAQIDKSNPEQNTILKNSTHFNPVDMVCGLTDYQGFSYNLEDFVDHNQGFISNKTLGGVPILALELPGLWNGAMAFWNTLFVEVPSMTFNPVKTVNDLLRESHQN